LGFALLLVAGCAGGGEPEPALDLRSVVFHVYKTDEGVHPSQSVLSDPNNPFANVSVDDLANPSPGNSIALKWQLAQSAPPAAKFYAWATVLTGAPSGENQFYTADALKSVYTLLTSGQLPNTGDAPDTVKQMVVAAYTAQLTYFPEDYNHNAAGVADFDYSTASLQAIQSLGAPLPPGWLLVTDSSNQTRAVKF
jgi:hypothetical protein